MSQGLNLANTVFGAEIRNVISVICVFVGEEHFFTIQIRPFSLAVMKRSNNSAYYTTDPLLRL